jgi:hypothetical protein
MKHAWIAVLFAGSLSTILHEMARGVEQVVAYRPRYFAGEISGVNVLPAPPAPVLPLAETRIPNDLDLENMSKWCLNYLKGSISIENDYASSYGNWPLNDPPFSVGGDRIAIGDSEVRNDLAFVLMREMSGISYGATEQQGLRKRILSYQHESGLFTPSRQEHTDVLWATAWMARSLIESFATTGDRDALARAGKSLEAIRNHALAVNDQGQFRLAPPTELKFGNDIIHFAYRNTLDFCIVEPFISYHEVTGDERMLEIACKLADGRLAGFGQYDTAHMHSHMHSVVPIAHLGAVTGDKRYLDWAENELERRTSQRTDFGWVEATKKFGASETCALADHIHIWVYLGQGGRTRYYDFVERAVRNYLPQVQFFINDETFQRLWSKETYKDRESHRALMQRLEGGFLCRTDPDDRWSKGTISLEGCCPPTGMTGLYLAWKNIVRKSSEGIWINLAFNHESPEAHVVSFLPDQGRLTVVAKLAQDYHIRVPSFVPWNQVRAFRGRLKYFPTEVKRNGEYVEFPNATVGEELTVTYPLVAFVQKMNVGGRNLEISWKGNLVTDLSHKGKVWPLFEKVPYPTPPFSR